MTSISAIVTSIKQKITKRDVLLLSLIFAAYFASRLQNILALPIFSDEGIYIRWAKVATYDPAWRFISLTDGKQPLQTWGTMPFIKILPDHLLLAGRLFSVTTGVFALTGFMALCGYLWGKKASYIGALLYLVTPYFLFYDRMALVDSGVNAAFIWILLFSLILPKYKRLDVALIYGVVAGVGLLAKSSVAVFLALSYFGGLFLLEQNSITLSQLFNLRKLKNILLKMRFQILDYYFLLLVTSFVALSLYLTQKFFSPFFHYIGEKNLTFILSPAEWIAHPFGLVPSNISMVPLYVAWESGWVPMVLGIAGFFVILKKSPTLGAYLGIWVMLPFLMIINFNKVIFPRYLIFFPTLLTLFSVAFFVNIKRTKIFQLSLCTTLVLLLIQSAPILFDVTNISFPPVDMGQYVKGQTAVWGASELMQIVRNSTKDGKSSIVMAEGNFGLIADVLEVMKKPNDKIYVEGFWPLKEENIYGRLKDTDTDHVFVAFSHREEFPVHWREIMDSVKVFEKPGTKDHAVYLFKLKKKEVVTNPEFYELYAN